MKRPIDILELAHRNNAYRRVVHTGDASQVVVMSIPVGDDIGEEEHENVEQTLIVVEGDGEVFLDGSRRHVLPGDLVMVHPKVRHNLKNVGAKPLKLFTIYVPPNHIDGRVHMTKEDAEADTEDKNFVF